MSPLRFKRLPEGLDFGSLFGPCEDYSYFEGGAEHAFQPDATRFELVNASVMADLALLSYLKDADQVDTRLARGGLELVELLDAGSDRRGLWRGGTQCFVARDPKRSFAVVAFRGTEVSEVRDILTDLNVFPDAAAEAPGQVHGGFKDALDEVWEDVRGLLDKAAASRVWFTGHSLGGALATLASSRHAGDQGVYTFGSPRVGDRDYEAGYGEYHYRFVNQNDLVTRVPPGPIFRHVGSLKYIGRYRSPVDTGRIHDKLSFFRKLKDRWSGRADTALAAFRGWRDGELDQIPIDGLVDHSPVHYSIKVWNEYVRSST